MWVKLITQPTAWRAVTMLAQRLSPNLTKTNCMMFHMPQKRLLHTHVQKVANKIGLYIGNKPF